MPRRVRVVCCARCSAVVAGWWCWGCLEGCCWLQHSEAAAEPAPAAAGGGGDTCPVTWVARCSTEETHLYSGSQLCSLVILCVSISLFLSVDSPCRRGSTCCCCWNSTRLRALSSLLVLDAFATVLLHQCYIHSVRQETRWPDPHTAAQRAHVSQDESAESVNSYSGFVHGRQGDTQSLATCPDRLGYRCTGCAVCRAVLSCGHSRQAMHMG